MRNRLLITAAVLIAAAFGALFGGVFRNSGTPASAALAGAQSAEDFKAGFSLNASTASLAAELQSRLRRTRGRALVRLLGLAYQQRARETGDPAYYPKSAGALRSRARPRLQGLSRRQRPRLAGALPSPLPRRPHPRRAGPQAQPVLPRAPTA